MVETCSDDLSTLINELEKLCAYVGDGGSITVNEINEVCSRSVETSIYTISKAVLGGNLQEAYKILDDLLYMNTEPQFILMQLSSAYVDIYRAYVIRSSGQRTDDVAKELGYYNTAFRLRDAERSLSKLSDVQIVKSVKLLAECDKLMKSTRGDNRALLEKVIVDLALVARGRV
jgi:DNA polymerase-3 subunit delta